MLVSPASQSTTKGSFFCYPDSFLSNSMAEGAYSNPCVEEEGARRVTEGKSVC